MNYIKNIRNAALYSPYEIKVRDLTSNDPFPGNAQRARKDVAEATSNYENFLITMRVIWERMNDSGRNWRHVYKGLQLLEYLLVYGSENVVLDAKNNANRVKILRSFTFVDDHSFNDYGEGVRRLSERVLKTLNSDEKLREYRHQAADGTFQGFPKLSEPSAYAQKGKAPASQAPSSRNVDREDYRDEPPRREDYRDEPRSQQRQQPRRDDYYDEEPRRQQQPSYNSQPPQRQSQPQYQNQPSSQYNNNQYQQSQQGNYQRSSNLVGGLDYDNEDAYGNDEDYLDQYRRQPQQSQQHSQQHYQDQSYGQEVSVDAAAYSTEAPLTSEEQYELESLRSELEKAKHENEIIRRQLDKAKTQYDNLQKMQNQM
ncbi:hypothetical protein AKO1_015726 [Acrasis kona]|uniref:ENTH domain-containing protein n=1 Tax=Acrasis kona TaxID=1008807 RepID=A0AAW2ZGN5_9EUKA